MTKRFEEIYRRHVQAVFRFALSCVSRRQVAEDITSETFLALLRNLEGIDESQLPGWLITVARNRARDYWRRQATEQKYMEACGDAEASTQAATDGCLLESPGLKSVHRLCLTLRYVEGMSRSEIAEATGMSESQVKGHLQYGLQLLRKVMALRENG
jgi:RNA polymerase sigma-70 factor (ECF subfamily)